MDTETRMIWTGEQNTQPAPKSSSTLTTNDGDTNGDQPPSSKRMKNRSY